MLKFYHKLTNSILSKASLKSRLEKESNFYSTNRKEVLQHYRFLLKELPKFYPRRLQKRTIYIQTCQLFHQGKILSSLQETKDRSNHLREFVKSIKQGDQTVIGSLLPARAGQYSYLAAYYRKLKYRLE